MEVHVRSVNQYEPGSNIVNLRCPNCRKRGTFEPLVKDADCVIPSGQHVIVGERRCPDPECQALIFFAKHADGSLTTFPPETIDFDASDLPAGVLDTLTEAIACHANECYKASAMMVRKTLEEMCHDRGAEGKNLVDRIKALRDKVVLPEAMFTGLDDLRLLGNDAAHVESKDYDEIGREEVEVSLDFTKEVLKAVYQHEAFQKRLAALKKSRAET